MAHEVDGYDLTYVSRTSWKAERRYAGRLLDQVPVTWTDGWRHDPKTNARFLAVYYKDAAEMETRRTSAKPFVIAVAAAHDKEAIPRVFHRFIGVFEVLATGVQFDNWSIEAKLLRRLNARKDG